MKLYRIKYESSKGTINGSRYFKQKKNAVHNAKFNIGKSASFHDTNDKIIRATVYRGEEPVCCFGEPASPVGVTSETAYGKTVPLSFTILCF